MKSLALMALIFVSVCSQVGCSVGMALSGEKGADLSVLSVGQARGIIEMELAKTVRERPLADGTSYVTYEYAIGNQPSVGRAVAHGVLDVITGGLWEVIGTPIEGVAAASETHQVTVVYDSDDRVVAVNPIGAIKREDEAPFLGEESDYSSVVPVARAMESSSIVPATQ